MPEKRIALINVSKGLLGVSLATLAAMGGATGNIWLAGAAVVPGAVLASGLLSQLVGKKEEAFEIPAPPWWGRGEKAWQSVCSHIEEHLSLVVEDAVAQLQQIQKMPTAANLRQAFTAEVLRVLSPHVAIQDRVLLADYLTPFLLEKSALVLQHALTSLQEETLARMLEEVAALLDDAHTAPSLTPAVVSVQAIDGTVTTLPDAILELERKWKQAAYDVYISYAEADATEVMKIGERLKERGILPWFDAIDADPGSLARAQQEEQIRKILAATVFVGQHAIDGGQALQMYSFIEQFVQRGCRVIPVVLPGVSGKPQVPVYLANFAGVDFRQQNPEPLGRLIWGITGQR